MQDQGQFESEAGSTQVSQAMRPADLVAGACSIAAGAVHLAASQTHTDNISLSRLMIALGGAQVIAGVVLFAARRPAIRWLVVAVNVTAVSSWLFTRVRGLSWVPGLERAEAPQTADTVTALLALVAVLAAVWTTLSAGARDRQSTALSQRLAIVSTLAMVPLLGIVGVTSAGSHNHDHGDGEPVTLEAGAWEIGATTTQVTDTEKLVRETQAVVDSYSSVEDAESKGFVRINGDHLLYLDRVFDDKQLDPTALESLVVGVRENGEEYIRGGMYLMDLNESMRDVPRFGGPLMVWHSHGGFCFQTDGVIQAGPEAGGDCPEETVWLDDPPMVHIYNEPQIDEGVARSYDTCGTFTFMDLPFNQAVPGCASAIDDHGDGTHAHG